MTTHDQRNQKNQIKTIKTVQVRYFAVLKEERGLGEESVQTEAETILALYEELKTKYNFVLPASRVRVAVKDEFVDFDSPLEDQSEIILVPPVAGG